MKTDEYRELRGLARHDANVRRAAEARRATECEGKAKFSSYSAAKRAIRPTTHGKVLPFRCHQCSGWHLGADARRDKRIAREFA